MNCPNCQNNLIAESNEWEVSLYYCGSCGLKFFPKILNGNWTAYFYQGKFIDPENVEQYFKMKAFW